MPKLPPKLKAHLGFYIKSQLLAKNPRFCLGVGMGLGAPARALSPPFPAIFPNNQRADPASRSLAGMANSQCCQCHTCCPDCATCLFSVFVCHVRAGGCPSPGARQRSFPGRKQTWAQGYGRSQQREGPLEVCPCFWMSPPSGKGPQDAASISQSVPG